MNAVNMKLARGIFGALVVGALGFGATQAMASPEQADGFARCYTSQEQDCQGSCAIYGASGRCSRSGNVYYCECYVGGENPIEPIEP